MRADESETSSKCKQNVLKRLDNEGLNPRSPNRPQASLRHLLSPMPLLSLLVSSLLYVNCSPVNFAADASLNGRCAGTDQTTDQADMECIGGSPNAGPTPTPEEEI